jgi:hypothetical protein
VIYAGEGWTREEGGFVVLFLFFFSPVRYDDEPLSGLSLFLLFLREWCFGICLFVFALIRCFFPGWFGKNIPFVPLDYD